MRKQIKCKCLPEAIVQRAQNTHFIPRFTLLDVLEMARERLPPISGPLPVLLHAPEHEKVGKVMGPKEIPKFEGSISSHSWLYNLWTKILSGTWVENLLLVRASHDTPSTVLTPEPQSYIPEPVNTALNQRLLANGYSEGNPDQHTHNGLCRMIHSKSLPDLPRLSWTDWRAEGLLRVVGGPLDDIIHPL